MAKDYSQQIPIDKNGTGMVESHPPFVALASYGSDNRATSSAVGLSPGTSVVEITAGGADVVVKWGNSVIGVTPTGGFDTAVAAGTSRLLVVPRFRAASASIQSYNPMEGLYSHMAIASFGPGSVLTAEY